MGQYYIAANIDKMEWLESSMFLKLMESAWIDNEFVRTIEHLIYQEWFGDRVIWAGDYMDAGRFLPADASKKEKKLTLYDYAQKKFKKRRIMKKVPYYRFLVNHSKLQYVDKDKVRDNDGWRVHPLPILTAASNGQGGGDYFAESGQSYVGTWCGDCIAVAHDPPGQAFQQIIPDFYE